MYEFNSVLLSVLPYQYFKEYLQEQKPEFMPYLRVLMLFEQWQEFHNELDENEYLMTERKIDVNEYVDRESATKERI